MILDMQKIAYLQSLIQKTKTKIYMDWKKQIISYFAYLIKTPKYTNDEKILKGRNLEDKLLENPQPKSYLFQTSKRYKQTYKEFHETLIEFIDNSLELFTYQTLFAV